MRLWSSACHRLQSLRPTPVYGVALETALTDDVNAKDSALSKWFFSESIRPAGKSIIVGPVVQWNFTNRFAVELTGLFRELHFDSQVGSYNSNPTITSDFWYSQSTNLVPCFQRGRGYGPSWKQGLRFAPRAI